MPQKLTSHCQKEIGIIKWRERSQKIWRLLITIPKGVREIDTRKLTSLMCRNESHSFYDINNYFNPETSVMTADDLRKLLKRERETLLINFSRTITESQVWQSSSLNAFSTLLYAFIFKWAYQKNSRILNYHFTHFIPFLAVPASKAMSDERTNGKFQTFSICYTITELHVTEVLLKIIKTV